MLCSNSSARFLLALLREMAIVLIPSNEAAKIIRMPSLPGPSTTRVLFFSIGDISKVCKAAARGSVSIAMNGAMFEGI
jgi:hypothetical protein